MMLDLLSKALLEREDFNACSAGIFERMASRLAAVNRYRMARKYCFGDVIDAACGCGYGSAMLARVPAVSSVIGLDRDERTFVQAIREFGDDATFAVCDFERDDLVRLFREADTVVSIETIEHLEDPLRFLHAVRDAGVKRFVVTFPSFPTSSFNPYHLNDITLDEVSAALGRDPDVAIEMDDAVWLAVY